MKYRAGKQIFTALVIVVASAPALFGAELNDQRFSFTETPNGFIRLDKVTGQVSACTMRESGLVCKMAADERQAYQEEINRIDARLNKLQERITSLESGEFLKKKAKKSFAEAEQELDQALKLADKAFRHFFNLMQDVTKKPKKDAI
jgi:exonuclease VII small subunit